MKLLVFQYLKKHYFNQSAATHTQKKFLNILPSLHFHEDTETVGKKMGTLVILILKTFSFCSESGNVKFLVMGR